MERAAAHDRGADALPAGHTQRPVCAPHVRGVQGGDRLLPTSSRRQLNAARQLRTSLRRMRCMLACLESG